MSIMQPFDAKNQFQDNKLERKTSDVTGTVLERKPQSDQVIVKKGSKMQRALERADQAQKPE